MRDSRGKLIDFAQVRSLIPMNDVLRVLVWEPTSIQGSQLRGTCPLPNCRSTSRRTFSVHLDKQAWHCFACGRHGNQLDLWAMLTGHDLCHVAIDLCGRFNKPVPYHAPQQARPPRNSHRKPPAGPR